MSIAKVSTFSSAPSWTITSPWSTTFKVKALTFASYLTEPICKAREYFYTLAILDKTCKTAAEKAKKSALLKLGVVTFALLAPLTAPFGALLRGAVATLESKPYLHLERPGSSKTLPPNKTLTLVSHNQCYMPAGFAITDGGVTPASDKARMHANLQQIRALDPDIVCLYEVPDICDAEYISAQLPNYPFLIPVAGVRAIGPSSMMYVASKYKIAPETISFIPFAKGTELTGRAKYSEKGVLSFDITSNDSNIATIISTHLQHSEIPAKPEKEEQIARALQMDKIAKKIQSKIAQNSAVIFTGDLNLDETELEAHQISFLRRDPRVKGIPTWGGDGWCAKLMNKPSSDSLTLDYTFIAGSAKFIATQIFRTGYSGAEFKPTATSDHDLLFSRILL